MSFAASAVPGTIQLVDNHYLLCTLLDSEGNEHSASIDLDEIVGNIDGEFKWGGVKFSESTQDIWLDTAHAPALVLLKGEARREDEEYQSTEINLNDLIQNGEGRFEYLGPRDE